MFIGNIRLLNTKNRRTRLYPSYRFLNLLIFKGIKRFDELNFFYNLFSHSSNPELSFKNSLYNYNYDYNCNYDYNYNCNNNYYYYPNNFLYFVRKRPFLDNKKYRQIILFTIPCICALPHCAFSIPLEEHLQCA